MKRFLVAPLILCCLLWMPCAQLKAQGFLRAKGKQIVDEKGKSIVFRGMGLGGWMLQEGYMYQLSFLGQEYRIREKITESVGAEKAAAFYESWLANHTTRKDIKQLALMGFNSIRLPMHYALYTLPVEKEPIPGQNTWLEKGFQLTDSLLQWCKDNRLYLILDLHAAPGGQGNDLAISDRNPALPSLWDSPANQAKTIALWRKLAQRYAKEQWIAGYDLINETNWGFDDSTDVRGTKENRNIPLRKLLMEITQAIREVDQQHIIFLEGNGFANNYRGVFPPWDDNMVISFHKYGNYNTKKSIEQFLALREKYNMPLWLGESGENFNTWFTEAIRLMEQEGIGWTWWPHKKIGINNPIEMKRPEGYDRLLADWSGKGPKLTAADAWTVLQDWLNNTKLENNSIRRDVVDAMFRQVTDSTAIPFLPHRLSDSIRIQAVDYDLGAQGIAYYDKDSASYHYTPGVNTTGNKGRTYRNDGVDIKTGAEGPFVFSTEDGEWLQYTIEVTRKGDFELSLRATTEKEGSIVSVLAGENKLRLEFPAVTSFTTFPLGKIPLKKGTHRIKLQLDKGGIALQQLELRRTQK